MAERRMFAKSIVFSEKFLSLPLSVQGLYYHLGMEAEKKGILYNARAITRAAGAYEEDLETLIKNGYIRKVDDVYEIVHWYENNGVGETAKKRLTYQYRQFRKKVLERDKVCQFCGSSKKLEVHHIKHFSEYPELRLNPDNAVVLCENCHKELHRSERNGKKENV